MENKKIGKREYFASVPVEEPDKLAAGMQEKMREWVLWCSRRGFIGMWKKKLSNYYGISVSGVSSQAITQGGSEGELAMLKVNDLHNLIQNQLVLVTGQRPAGIARAINSNSDSLKSARIATALTEHYMKSGWEKRYVQACEIALLCDESFLLVGWNKDAGDPIAVDQETGQPEMSGDAFLGVHCPWNVARDPGMTVETNEWNIITYNANRYDMAAKYPRFKESILMTGEATDTQLNGLDYIPNGSDAIRVHLLIHKRTPAIPNGRYALLIGDDIVLDTDLPYPEYPLYRMASEDIIDGCMGYCAANDIMAMEECTDALNSVVTTNQTTFGGQCLIGVEGMDLNFTELAKGVRIFLVPPDQVDKLKPLDLLHTPPEIFNYMGILNAKKEQQVGVNSVVRGQPEGQLAGASGSALALIQAQAISFNSGTQRSYFGVMSDSMTGLIGILRVYADTPRIARIVGRARSSGLKEFKWTGQDLNSVSSVVYEITNPISQTLGGRLTMAQDLLKMPDMIKSPKQYLDLVQTGTLDVLTEDAEADQLLILQENEWLSEGRPFEAVVTQNHADHIRSHSSQITLELQEEEPETVQRFLEHMQHHIDIWQKASVQNPGILLATNQPPLIPPGFQPGIGGPGDETQPAGPGQLPNTTQEPDLQQLAGGGQPDIMRKAQQVRQPQLPKVAGTDDRAFIPGVVM